MANTTYVMAVLASLAAFVIATSAYAATPSYTAVLRDHKFDIVGTSESPPASAIPQGPYQVDVTTDDTSSRTIIIRSVNPLGEVTAVTFGSSSEVPALALSLVFTADSVGAWKVEALFLNQGGGFTRESAAAYPSDAENVIAYKVIPFETSHIVIPESPVGAIALTIASLGVLGGYVAVRRSRHMA